MHKYLYDAVTNAFYPLEKKESYKAVGLWPERGIEVDEDLFFIFQSPPPGKVRIGGADGMPAWDDIPPPTQDEMVAMAIARKSSKITEANIYINEKQWPGKAALGRIKENEKLQYGLWLDYLDALQAIITEAAPDILWPERPKQ